MTSEMEMSVKVLLFAQAADLAGRKSVTVKLPGESSVEAVETQLVAAHPELDKLAKISRWAVGHEFVSRETMVDGSAEVAMIPPVSGG